MMILHTIDTRDVDDDVDHVGAQLIGLHIHGIRVGRNINLTDYIKEKRFLHVAVRDKDVEEVFEGSQLGHELLDNLAKGLEDGVVINGRQVKTQADVYLSLRELVIDCLLYFMLAFALLFIGHEMVTIHLVDEDFNVYVRIDRLREGHDFDEPDEGLLVGFILCVKDEHEGATGTEHKMRCDQLITVVEITSPHFVITKIHISREIPDLKLDESVVCHVFDIQAVCGLNEKCFVRGHLVEYDFRHTRLA
mmetsp:Transcript_31964/g.43275  ORF Transcript_31964/g.43275 Transcript_31964/m.43275 type:complete len:249 (-) Transcript_31964:201-947(-)